MKKNILASILTLVTAFSVLTTTKIQNANAFTGWSYQNDNWYYYKGNIHTGWLQQGSKWYYFNCNGIMVTGWQQINGTWYYFYNNGEMATGWINQNGYWYYLQYNGTMNTGWSNIQNKWYYLDNSGLMKTGWILDNNKWYYLHRDGHMAMNETINGYYLGTDGYWINITDTKFCLEKYKLNKNDATKLFFTAFYKTDDDNLINQKIQKQYEIYQFLEQNFGDNNIGAFMDNQIEVFEKFYYDTDLIFVNPLKNIISPKFFINDIPVYDFLIWCNPMVDMYITPDKKVFNGEELYNEYTKGNLYIVQDERKVKVTKKPRITKTDGLEIENYIN